MIRTTSQTIVKKPHSILWYTVMGTTRGFAMFAKERVRPFVFFFIYLIATLFAIQALVTAGSVYSAESSGAADWWLKQSTAAVDSADSRWVKENTPQDPFSLAGSTPNVQPIGHIGGASYAVAVLDNYAYIGQGPSMIILNIADPAGPVVLGKSSLLPGMVEGLTVLGDYAYIAAGEGGLRIINIADPANPIETGFLVTSGKAKDIVVQGNYAYIAEEAPDEKGTLRIIDITNAASPTITGSILLDDPSQGVDVAGNLACVAGHAGLRIIDITNPAAPAETGFYDTPMNARDVDIAGTFAYVAESATGIANGMPDRNRTDDWGALRIIDISDPKNPDRAGYFNTWGYAWSVKVSGSNAYITSDIGLFIVDISNTAEPDQLSYLPMNGPLFLMDLAISGNYLSVATGSHGELRVFDVSDSLAPFEAGRYESPLREAVSVTAVGDIAYVADSGFGLRIIDIANPSSPILTGFHETSSDIVDLAVEGIYAYVIRSYGLDIIDVEIPSKPQKTGHFDLSEFPAGIAVDNNLAYVTRFQGLRIVDVSNLAALAEVGSFQVPDYANGVAIDGNFAYIAGGDTQNGQLLILDVANPAVVNEEGHADIPGPASDVAIDGNHAYVAAYWAGLRVITVTDPSNPSEEGFYDTSGFARAVAIAGVYAFVADERDGLRMIDIANSAKPVEVGYYDTAGRAGDVAVVGNKIFVADKSGGLLILQYSDSSVPPKADFLASPTSGVPPMTVQFTNLSTGVFDQCLWNFGDNHTDDICNNPSHSYVEAGNYSVSLTVKGPGGEDTKKIEKCVSVINNRLFLPAVLHKK
jgi:hypothetical protein